MNKNIAVTSRSFSTHPLLRAEIEKQYQHVTFNDTGKTLVGKELIAFLRGHEKAIVGLEKIDENVFTQLPELKVISRFGVGLDTLDLNYMKKNGIRLAFTAGANKRSVAELVISFAIMMLRQLPYSNSELKTNIWKQRKGRQLTNATVGIVGLGAVGKDLAALLKAFDCRLIAFDVVDQSSFCSAHNIQQTSLDMLLAEADIVSLHLPLTTETHLLLNSERLAILKSNAILINTARGGLVDEHALKQILENKKIAGAAFDVFAQEPPTDKELLHLENFFATPHIGGSTEEAILAMGHAAINGLETATFL